MKTLRSPSPIVSAVLPSLVAGALVALLPNTTQAQTNFFEDFETGNLNKWSLYSGATALTADNTKNKVPTSGTWSGKITTSACGMYNNVTGAFASSSKFTVWFYYNGVAKDWCEIRTYNDGGTYPSGTLNQVLAIGTYNSPTWDGTSDTTRFQGRIAFGGNPPSTTSTWFTLDDPNCPKRSTGWHKLEIERGVYNNQTVLSFYVDGFLGKAWTNNAGTAWGTIIAGAHTGTTAGDEWWDGFQLISGQPYIGQDPTSQTATVGDPADLTVGAVGEADGPHYQWYKNGAALSGKTSSSLHFDSAALSDTGSYTVVVSNFLAMKTSAVAVLTVNTPLYATVDPTNYLVNPGSTVTFTATGYGQGTIAYQWQKNGAVLADKTDSALTLSDVTSSDAGTYTVTVHNGIDADATSNPATLSVNRPPAIAVADTNATVGQTFSMVVPVTDDYAPLAVPFQTFQTNAVGAVVMFAKPNMSGTTGMFVDGAGRTYITNAFPAGHGSSQVLYSHFSFTNENNLNWLRLTTTDTSSSGVLAANPIVSFIEPLCFDIYSDKDLALAVGLRETDATGDIGANGGSGSGLPIEQAALSSPIEPKTGDIHVTAGAWTTVMVDLPTVSVCSFVSGNNKLNSSTGKGVLEHLCITDGTSPGTTGDYRIWLDNFICVPTNALRFSLDAAPTGATINPVTGVIAWTPAAQTTESFTVKVTDDMGLYSTTSFTVKANAPAPPNLAIHQNGSNVVLTWTDPSASLQSAPAPTGPFTTITGAASGYTTSATTGARFFRLVR